MLQELMKLHSDPVLKDLHRQAVAWHRAKIADIKSRPDWRDFIEMVYTHPGIKRPTAKPAGQPEPEPEEEFADD